MTNIWQWFENLPRWAVALMGGAALVIIGAVTRALLQLGRPRRVALYTLEGRPTLREAQVSPTGESTVDDAQLDEAGDEEDRELRELGIRPNWPLLASADWARGRALCPCCGYPGGYDPFSRTACAICDWDEPEAESPEWGVPRGEWRRALAAARANYEAAGSALSAEDRAAWAGELTDEQVELRRKVRALFDYLQSGERPDTSEVLAEADVLVARLREVMDEPRWREDDD